MSTWTKRQDGQTTIYQMQGFAVLQIHKIGRQVYLNSGEQFIPYTSLAAAKKRVQERASGTAFQWVR